jgi:hypothetical protein
VHGPTYSFFALSMVLDESREKNLGEVEVQTTKKKLKIKI